METKLLDYKGYKLEKVSRGFWRVYKVEKMVWVGDSKKQAVEWVKAQTY